MWLSHARWNGCNSYRDARQASVFLLAGSPSDSSWTQAGSHPPLVDVRPRCTMLFLREVMTVCIERVISVDYGGVHSMRINFTSSVLVISALLSSAAQAQPTGPLPQPARPTIPPFAPILPEPLIESVRLSTFSHPKLNANATDGPPALRQGAAMVIVVGNVGGAQSVSITEVKSNNCGWVNQPNINYAPLTPDREGKIQQTRIGVFTTGNSSCTVRATIVIQKHQTSSPNPPLELVSAPFQLTGSRTVDLDTFSKIDRLFNFELKYGYGVCEGFSDFGAGRHPVGKVADPRNDFAIAIRSGPIGTDCRWHSQMVELPPGVKPIINTWDITASASNESQQNLPPEAIAQVQHHTSRDLLYGIRRAFQQRL